MARSRMPARPARSFSDSPRSRFSGGIVCMNGTVCSGCRIATSMLLKPWLVVPGDHQGVHQQLGANWRPLGDSNPCYRCERKIFASLAVH